MLYITLTSHGYLSFTMNLLKSIERIDPLWKLRVYATDKTSYDILTGEGYECVLKELHSDSFIDYDADGYNEFCFMKLQCIIDALVDSEYVMYIDGDVFVLGDFRHILEYTHDAVFQSNDPLHEDTKTICAGIMLVNRRVVPWFNEGIRTAGNYKHDEGFIIETYKDSGLDVTLWSQSIFCNGRCFDCIPDTALMMHYNWVIGEVGKKKRMIQNDHWISSTLLIRVRGGIENRLCDILGASVIAKYMGLGITYEFEDDVYDSTLFTYELNRGYCVCGTELRYLCTSLSPVMVHRFIKNVPIYNVYNTFVEYAQKLKPCSELEMNINGNLSEAYGICVDFESDELFSDIRRIVQREKTPKFFLCIDDLTLRHRIQSFIEDINNDVCFIDVRTIDDRRGARDILNLFALSRCKAIFASDKYIISSLIGNVPVYMYNDVDLWRPVLRDARIEDRVQTNDLIRLVKNPHQKTCRLPS